MIGVYLQGRLGNQLFQYAFAISKSQELNTTFFIDETFEKMIINKYFELPSYNFWKGKIDRFLFGKNKIVVEISNENSFADNVALLTKDDCFYKGFFQVDGYFNRFTDKIKNEFKVKSRYKINVRKTLGIANDKPLLVLHVRRTDYLIYGDASMGGKDLSLPLSYYKNCLAKIPDLSNYNIVFVTDDEEYVRSNFAEYKPVISSNSNPIVDFQILQNADVLILANSSFSWWAAYLNFNCKLIMAPKHWLGFLIGKEYPCDIIPTNWIQIDFV